MKKTVLFLSLLIIIFGIVYIYKIYMKTRYLKSICGFIKTNEKYKELICQTNGFKLFKNNCKYIIITNNKTMCLKNYSVSFYINNVKGYVITKDFIFIYLDNVSYLKIKNKIYRCKKISSNIFRCFNNSTNPNKIIINLNDWL